MPSSMPGSANTRAPKEKTPRERNDAQKNAAERVSGGTDNSVLPVAEQHAGEDCDSSLEDE
ncbi:MAG TPA: hypothetical protein VGM36_06730 [Rhizomicrobium sp.]